MVKNEKTLEEKLEEAIVKDVPYEVPDNWVWVNSLNIFDVEYGKNLPTKNLIEEGYPVFGANGYIGFFNSYNVDKDKVLISCRGAYSGNVNTVVKNSFVTNNSLIISQKDERISNGFLFYMLKAMDREKLVSGTAQPQVTVKAFESFDIVLPPLKEQQRIVDKIESLFEKLDKAKELIEEARDGFEKRKSAILEKAFRGELTKNWRDNNNTNKTWEQEKLKDIAQITSGGTPSRKHPEYFRGDIPWIKTGEITWNKIYDSEEHITEEAIENSSTKLIPRGAVLVAMYGQGLTRGRAGILEKDACTNQAVCALIPNDRVLNNYLYYYFMSNYWRFRQLAKGGNQENLSGKVIGAFEIEIPSIEEQKEIVKTLDKLLEEESEIEELTQLEDQIELIKKSILAKAFRGELGTNCKEDESAVELLKEILSKE